MLVREIKTKNIGDIDVAPIKLLGIINVH